MISQSSSVISLFLVLIPHQSRCEAEGSGPPDWGTFPCGPVTGSRSSFLGCHCTVKIIKKQNTETSGEKHSLFKQTLTVHVYILAEHSETKQAAQNQRH